MKPFQRICFFLCLLGGLQVKAQGPPMNLGNRAFGNNSGGARGKSDSLQKRDLLADSITLYFRYFDSTRNRSLDSSVNDFTRRLPLPYTFQNLGNLGSAARSLVYQPLMKPGFDAGFHAFDVYGFSEANTRFYQTTRPYTELGYMIGTKAEQMVDLVHTQNRTPNFNVGLEYRFINAPGYLKNSNASQSSLRITTQFRSRNKRYGFFLVYFSNKSGVSENGGVINRKRLDSLSLNDPFELETRLGLSGAVNRNPFNTTVTTGNLYRKNQFLFRHQYDFGQRDSLVTDSNVVRLFYPRFRIEHTLRYGTEDYRFLDLNTDTVRYQLFFNYPIQTGTVLEFRDRWRNLQNEFSLISFPQKNNQSQFFKTGVSLQQVWGTIDTNTAIRLNNVFGTVEYRNRTRNQVWDIEAKADLFLSGFHAGDYAVWASLGRSLGKKSGWLRLGMHQVNRSAAMLFRPESDFPLRNPGNYNKENNTKLFVRYELPQRDLVMGAELHLTANYLYLDSFFVAQQESKLFQVLQVYVSKKFKLAKHWNWYTEVHFQQAAGNPPLQLPLLLTRNRIAFEGNFFTNLNLSTGLEFRYMSGFQPDNYSPFLGRYFYQQQNRIANRPDLHAFLHFRIKSFSAFVRAENLQTLGVTQNGFGFNTPNFPAYDYPAPTLWTRVGIFWRFVN
ncbi:MAG: hypothetical protein EAZ62_06035 [Sphingobacteriia bacterium]|nr:MAG: hypothetical protein EAZ62_06035 [Sphingobacteriia bacterium]